MPAMEHRTAIAVRTAVLLDALGTLVELEPPWVHLAAGARHRAVDERLVAAVRAEMAYYREHSHEGRDPRRWPSCARAAPRSSPRELGREVDVETMMARDPLPRLSRRGAGAGRAARAAG